MKRLLVLGAGRGQVALIKTAKEMGVYVICASHSLNYPGVKFADEVCLVDISNPESVLFKTKDLSIDGCVTACIDTGLNSIGHLCDMMKLSGLSREAASMCSNKLLMKQRLVKRGVSTANFVKVGPNDDLAQTIRSLTFPLIVKATDLQGSRGIYICRDFSLLQASMRNVFSLSKKDYCIIEEYIEGEEFGAQAFVYNGEVIFVLPHGDNTYMSSTSVPVGHYAPLERDTSFESSAKRIVVDAINAIGLDNCAVNVDLIERDGKIYVIELTGRVGATCLPELVSFYYGIDYYKMLILTALGNDPRPVFEARNGVGQPNASRMLSSEESGIVKDIVNKNNMNNTWIKEITFFVKPGDEIRKFTNANDCIGQVIVTGDNYVDCEQKIQSIKSNIEVVL